MDPFSSNGVSQASLDAECLAYYFSTERDVVKTLEMYYAA
jgi:hypothetical protein